MNVLERTHFTVNYTVPTIANAGQVELYEHAIKSFSYLIAIGEKVTGSILASRIKASNDSARAKVVANNLLALDKADGLVNYEEQGFDLNIIPQPKGSDLSPYNLHLIKVEDGKMVDHYMLPLTANTSEEAFIELMIWHGQKEIDLSEWKHLPDDEVANEFTKLVF